MIALTGIGFAWLYRRTNPPTEFWILFGVLCFLLLGLLDMVAPGRKRK